MYREPGDTDIDSGWRFFAGDESDEYCSDASHFELYDVNTIANYDPDILPLLGEPVGGVYRRSSETGRFVRDD